MVVDTDQSVHSQNKPHHGENAEEEARAGASLVAVLSLSAADESESKKEKNEESPGILMTSSLPSDNLTSPSDLQPLTLSSTDLRKHARNNLAARQWRRVADDASTNDSEEEEEPRREEEDRIYTTTSIHSRNTNSIALST